jgi:autotransporter-associated beta strand protein
MEKCENWRIFMLRKYGSGSGRRAVITSAIAGLTLWTQAAWNGAGTAGGDPAATTITDTANWSGGVIDGDFSTLTTEGATALVLASDLAFDDGATVTRDAADVTFASNVTEIAFASTNGITVGQLVNGNGLQYNTVLTGLTDTNGTLSRATIGLPSGAYTFVRPALNFNFGVLNGRATNVTVTVGSDSPGTSRSLTLNGRLCLSQYALPTNQLVFSSDISLNCGSGAIVTRESGAIYTNAVQPDVTLNGPVLLGDAATVTTRLTLDGGSLTINGLVTGANAKINVCGSSYAGSLTLTNPENSFSGGLTNTYGGGRVVANAARAIAPSGMSSAVGSGNISLNDTALFLQGFSERLITDRPWSVGGKTANGPSLYNYGTAPLELAGVIRNSLPAEDAPFHLYSSYQDRGTPNVISGFISAGAKVLAISVKRGTWRLTNPTNNFTGSLRTSSSDGATLQLTSLSNSGAPSAGGVGNYVYLESPGGSAMNVFEYIGTDNTTCNREFKPNGNASDNARNAIAVNGLGRLTLNGTFANGLTANWGGLQYRTLQFLGTGTGRFTGTGALGDAVGGSNTGRISVVKGGSGAWTFAGSTMNYQGFTDVRAGTLILDYTSYDQLTAATNVVRVCGGNLTLKATPSGSTSDTLSTYQFGLAASSGGSQYRSSALTLDANGGDGFALTAQSLAGDDMGQKFELVDLSSSAGNSLAVNSLGWRLNVVYGVLMNNASSTSDGAARSTLILRTAEGYGFPTLSGGGSGTLQRLSDLPFLPTSGTSVYSNYLLNAAGTLTPTADIAFNTLAIDTAAGSPTLALGARKFACSNAGRGVLLSGTNHVTVSGTGSASHVSASSIWFHNYLETNVTFHADFNLSDGTTKPHVLWGGTGSSIYSGTGLGNNFHLAGGVFRVTAPQTLSFSGKTFVLASGGTFEIGADLNGAGAGDFTCPVGAPGATTINVALYGDAGLSAAGANRVVNFGGAGAALTWGTGHFLTFFDGSTDYGYTFKLSSPYADATVEIKNPINLNGNGLHGRIRTVEVANGSAAVDALLSGALSGNAALAKAGAGTLELTGAQSYDGPLMVMGGAVRFGADGLVANAPIVQLRGGGLAAGNGTNALGPLELYADSVIEVGDGTATLAFADSSAKTWAGTLTITGKLGATTLRFGADVHGLTPAQLAGITNRDRPVYLDDQGYLRQIPGGTLIFAY